MSSWNEAVNSNASVTNWMESQFFKKFKSEIELVLSYPKQWDAKAALQDTGC